MSQGGWEQRDLSPCNVFSQPTRFDSIMKNFQYEVDFLSKYVCCQESKFATMIRKRRGNNASVQAYRLVSPRIQCSPLVRATDKGSFELQGQFLPGPNLKILILLVRPPLRSIFLGQNVDLTSGLHCIDSLSTQHVCNQFFADAAPPPPHTRSPGHIKTAVV